MFYPGSSAVLLYCVELLDKEKLDCICVVVLSCTSLAWHTSGVVLGLTVVTNFGGHPRPGPWSHHHHCHPHSQDFNQTGLASLPIQQETIFGLGGHLKFISLICLLSSLFIIFSLIMIFDIWILSLTSSILFTVSLH